MTALKDLVSFMSKQEIESTFQYIYKDTDIKDMFEFIYQDDLSRSDSFIDIQNMLPQLKELNQVSQQKNEMEEDLDEIDIIEK